MCLESLAFPGVPEEMETLAEKAMLVRQVQLDPMEKPGDNGSDGLDLKMRSNWKQCAWKRGDGKDNGLIQVSLNFTNSEYLILNRRMYLRV